jgi:hypothetical protein
MMTVLEVQLKGERWFAIEKRSVLIGLVLYVSCLQPGENVLSSALTSSRFVLGLRRSQSRPLGNTFHASSTLHDC